MTSGRSGSIRGRGMAMAIAAVLVATNAAAQSGSEAAAAAEALFTSARKLLDQRRYEEACPKLEESQRLDPGVGTLMYLAHCYEQTGRDASAWSTYRAAQSAATQAGQSERARIARQRADDLEPRLARLIVQTAPAPPPGLKVVRDGIVLGPALLGTPIPVDPGKHLVQATAPGRRAFATEITVNSGETLTIEVGPLAKSSDATSQHPPASTKPVSTTSHGTAAERDVRPAAKSGKGYVNTQRWLGVGTGLAGLVGLGIGGGFAFRSASLSDEAEQYRRPGTNIYDEPGYSYNSSALRARNAAVISSAVGATALLGGAVIYLTAPTQRDKMSHRAESATALVISPSGISIGTRWD